jgi:hypothetical protein
MSVAKLRMTISPREFAGWMVFFRDQDPDIPEIQMATLSLMVAQGLGSKKAKHDDYLIRKPTLLEKKGPTVAHTPDGVLTQNEVMSVFAGIAIPLDG